MATGVAKLSWSEYQEYFATPQAVQQGIGDRWVHFLKRTAKTQRERSFAIPGIKLGNVLNSTARGYDVDPALNYHVQICPHAYLAFTTG